MRRFVFSIPLNVPFRGITQRTGVLFEGPAGWAEWSPFPEYADAEAVAWMRAALEMAEEGHPQPIRGRVPVNGIVPGLPPAEAAARAVASGCSTVKVKVAARGETIDDDVARVAAVREALPHAQLRVDANGGWSVDDAAAAFRELEPLGLEYAEQPCATVEEMAALRAMDLGIPIAADESIRRASDPFKVKQAGAADIAMLKVQPLGGVRACLQLAEHLDMPTVVSSAVETSVGLAAGLALAAALPALPYACGLETARLLKGDVTGDILNPVDGELTVRTVRAEPELLRQHAAPPEITGFWLERWDRVTALMEDR